MSIKIVRKTFYILSILLLINSCSCKKPGYNGNEIILFLGEKGAGKSALCNSIFGQNVFKSGLMGLTKLKQEHIHEGKLYIDTPGFDKGSMNEQILKEIEEALKYNNNYKIVFVVKQLDTGIVLDNNTIDIINKICNAIQTDFEYGIVFNKFSKKRIQRMNEQGINQAKLHESLCMPIKPMKLPSLTVVLEESQDLKEEDNKYFQANDENRKKLMNFLSKLNAHKISPNQVNKIEI